MANQVPVIDISALVHHTAGKQQVAKALGEACREHGFFYIVHHGIDETLQQNLEQQSRLFFDQPLSQKMSIDMTKGGRAWRGYFPVGNELTSGKPDLKEGLYFGEELPTDHPAVQANLPLHGANLFPEAMPLFRSTILAYIQAMTKLGHTLMSGLSLSLGLDERYFFQHYTQDPLVLFRIFNYPASQPSDAEVWGVGEHTDYGVLTILKQDDSGGLEIKTRDGWISAPPIPNSFVCNIGDMLDRMTGGLYRSTPHRVRNTSGRPRLSYPFFFDPNFHAKVQALPIAATPQDDSAQRWDKSNVHHFSGTYGDYLLLKVGKVFPDLKQQVGFTGKHS